MIDMDNVEELLAEVHRLQEERKKISDKILTLMNRVRYIRKNGTPMKDETRAEQLYGKRLRDMTSAEKTAYYTQMQRERRARMKGENNNGKQ